MLLLEMGILSFVLLRQFSALFYEIKRKITQNNVIFKNGVNLRKLTLN